MSEYAQREWRRIGRDLYKLGLLTAIDHAALAGYCAAYGDFIEAEARIRKATNIRTVLDTTGKVIDLKPSGLFRMRNAALEMMHRYLTEFGMTPASRSRIRAGDVEKAVADLPSDEAFLKARGLRIVQ